MPPVDASRDSSIRGSRSRGEIARREGFFHWELEFAPVFAARRVRPAGREPTLGAAGRGWTMSILAEHEPWFGLAAGTNKAFPRGARSDQQNDDATAKRTWAR